MKFAPVIQRRAVREAWHNRSKPWAVRLSEPNQWVEALAAFNFSVSRQFLPGRLCR
jgi:hypothetical protein